MKISVIVPVYNTEEYLEKCLNSLISQTLKDIEIICVNDGSSDNSLRILQNYAQRDSRIKVIDQENQGVSSARNNALDIANGEYVGFIDSDDWVDADFFQKLYEAASTNNCDIACGDILRPKGSRYKSCTKIKTAKIYKKTVDKYKACNIPRKCYIMNKIYKRELLLKYKCYFPVGKTFEDIIWSHIAVDKLGNLITVPSAHYYYERNPESITETFNTTHQEDLKKACAECIEYVRKRGLKVNYKKYKAQKRFKLKLFGLELLDIKKWKHLVLFCILGIPICKIELENNF